MSQIPSNPELMNTAETISSKDLEFEVEGKKLKGLLFEAAGENKPGLVILRGGANIPNHQSNNPMIQRAMAEQGINSLSFDFRGVGESEGELSQTSIATRSEDARAAIETLKSHSSAGDIYLMGVSMGAPVAIEVAKEFGARGVILVSPAAYSAEARSKNFGPDFSAEIRKEKSWEGSPDFEALSGFDGKILVAFGGQDNVIPRPILETYAEIAKDKGQQVLEFEDAGHSFIRLEDAVSDQARETLYSHLASTVGAQ